MKFIFLILCVICNLLAKPIISVSIPPQAYFLQKIAKDSIQINTLIAQGNDPHTFEFKPQNLSQLYKSDLYLTIGLEFEKIWIPKIQSNLPNLPIIPITQGVQFITQKEDSHHEHNGHRDEEERDPHIWLSPIIAKTLARNIANILIKQYPQNKDFYTHNLKDLLQQLDALNHTIAQKLKSIPSRYFIVYHPSWEYFARAYKLHQIPIEFQGKDPKSKYLNQLIQTAKQYKIKTIFIQKGFSTQTSEFIAKACGAKIFITDPLAYDWENALLQIANELAGS